MSAHDPLCPRTTLYAPGGPYEIDCQCALIAHVRADERAKWSEVAVRNAGTAAEEARRAVAEEIAAAIEDAIVGEDPFDVQRQDAAIARRIGGAQ